MLIAAGRIQPLSPFTLIAVAVSVARVRLGGGEDELGDGRGAAALDADPVQPRRGQRNGGLDLAVADVQRVRGVDGPVGGGVVDGAGGGVRFVTTREASLPLEAAIRV